MRILLLILLLPSFVSAELVLSEVMANEPGGSVELEWIEVYNNSDSALYNVQVFDGNCYWRDSILIDIVTETVYLGRDTLICSYNLPFRIGVNPIEKATYSWEKDNVLQNTWTEDSADITEGINYRT